ncbi:MAG: efflux RND transporter periplasmic adaptor subunit [Planctomycetota bacterium]
MTHQNPPPTHGPASPSALRQRFHLDRGVLTLGLSDMELPVVAVDRRFFVADASLAPERFQPQPDEEGEISERGVFIAADDSRLSVEFRVLETHEKLVRCELAGMEEAPARKWLFFLNRLSQDLGGQALEPPRDRSDEVDITRHDAPHPASRSTPRSAPENSKPKRVTRWGWGAIAGGAVALLAVASLLSDRDAAIPAIKANAKFESRMVRVQTQRPGTVIEILTQPDQHVEAGQKLIGIEVASLQQDSVDPNIESLQKQQSELEQQRENLLAGIRLLERGLELARKRAELQLKTARAEQKVAQSELDLEQAKLNRLEAFAKKGSVNSEELDVTRALRDRASANAEAFQAQIDSAELRLRAADEEFLFEGDQIRSLPQYRRELEEAERRLGQLVQNIELLENATSIQAITAPTHGTVQRIKLSKGQSFESEFEALELRTIDRDRIRVDLNDDQRAAIEVGQKVKVSFPRTGQAIQGTIQEISDSGVAVVLEPLELADADRFTIDEPIEVEFTRHAR